MKKLWDFIKKAALKRGIHLKDVLKIAGYLARYAAEGEPDVLVGIVPLYNCTFFDVSISQDILKFRAVEAQFLAHQPATSYAMRIDFLLQPKYAFFMNLLMAMYYYGGGVDAFFGPQVMQLDPANVPQMAFPESLKYGTEVEEGLGQFIEKEVQNATLTFDDLKNMENLRQYWKFSKVRLTFPVITRDFIFFDMYIESVFFSKSVDEGDIIKGTVLLRKYIPPPKGYLYISSIRENVIEEGYKLMTAKAKEHKEAGMVGKYDAEYFIWTEDPALEGDFTLGAITQKVRNFYSKNKAATVNNAVYTYPSMVESERIVYSFGESNYYEDMLSYISKDVTMQYIYLSMKALTDVITNTFSDMYGKTIAQRRKNGNFTKRFNPLTMSVADVQEIYDDPYESGFYPYGQKFKVIDYDLSVEEDGTVTVYFNDVVVSSIPKSYVPKLYFESNDIGAYVDIIYKEEGVRIYIWLKYPQVSS